jgi:choline dehydrogenase-like flavoprotein
VDYSRGKGLGGTSLINFGLWNRGSREDWDEWARRVGDEAFAWENVKKVFERIESFKDPGYDDARGRFVKIEEASHGQSGPVSVEFSQQWEGFMPALIESVEEHGFEINRDLNSGDPIGVGFCPSTSRDGVRVTAKTAYLNTIPKNLEIRTGFRAARLLFEGKRVVGVEGVEGEKRKDHMKAYDWIEVG